MIYKLVVVFVLLLIMSWFYRERLADIVRAWYFGMPFPRYSVRVDKNIFILLDDGVDLATDIYRPNQAGQFPAILSRTPYNKNSESQRYAEIGKLFASQGFIFIVQDVRGKTPSEGLFYPHKNDASDGSQTIEWIVKQPWSDGQLSLFGFSYLGFTGWQALSETKHKISTIVPWFTSTNPYQAWHENNVVLLKQLVFWASKYGGNRTRPILQKDVNQALQNTTNWNTLDLTLTGKKIQFYRDFLEHPHYDKFWQQFTVSIRDMRQDTPALLGSGWYDQFLQATLKDFKELRKSPEGSKRRQSRLILGPWFHNPTQKITQFKLSSDANFLTQFPVMLKWYQYWTGTLTSSPMAPVTYYLMGKNRWQTSVDWPPPEATPVTFYLVSSSMKLASEIPPQEKSTLIFNPQHFVPSVGGGMLYSDGKEGPQNQAFLKTRHDVLLWTSPSLQHDVSIVGAPMLQLYFLKTPASFDLSLKLIDLFPDGTMQLITNGYHRLTRDPNSSMFSVSLDLNNIAYVLPKKHAIQIAVTPSDFPAHEPNHAVFNQPEATIEILTGPHTPSSLKILKLP